MDVTVFPGWAAFTRSAQHTIRRRGNGWAWQPRPVPPLPDAIRPPGRALPSPGRGIGRRLTTPLRRTEPLG